MIFNTTYVVPPERKEQFLEFVREFAHPLVEAKTVLDAKVYEVLADAPDGTDSLTFTVQLSFRNETEMEDWVVKNNKLNIVRLREKFGTSILCFSTVLEEVEI